MNVPMGNLKPLSKCPVCHKKYTPGVVTPLAESELRSTVHISCPSCGVSSILFVSANQWGVASIGVLTDLEGEESKRHFGREVVPVDHALDAYIFFKEQAGHLKEIL